MVFYGFFGLDSCSFTYFLLVEIRIISSLSISDFNKLLNSHRNAIANEIADVDAQLDELGEAAQALDQFTQPKTTYC